MQQIHLKFWNLRGKECACSTMGQHTAQPWLHFYDQLHQGSLRVHLGTTASRKPPVRQARDSSREEGWGRATGGAQCGAPSTRKDSHRDDANTPVLPWALSLPRAESVGQVYANETSLGKIINAARLTVRDKRKPLQCGGRHQAGQTAYLLMRKRDK